MSMDNLPSVIGNCRLVSKLGQGGMGAVYRATHETLGREVAIKMLPTEFTQNKEYVQRFLREARAAAHLKHANVVQVYDAGEQGGRYYIAMEFVDGTSLASMLKERGPIPEVDALRLMAQAAHGLAAAHALGLVHRDIKPENLMLGKDGVLKVADFGLVTAITKDEHLTQDGAMLGTPAYMSPEQCEGLSADGRSDIYSLGATFFRLITGTAPFSASTPIGILFKHKHEPAPDPRSINPSVSEPTAQLLLKMMAKQQNDRFQSASELAAVAEALVKGETPTIPLTVGQMVSTAGSGSGVGAVTAGTGGVGLRSAPTQAYTPTPGATPIMLHGATPPGAQVYTPTGMQAVTPSQMGPTVVSGGYPVVPGTTIIQPPRSNAPLIAIAAILFLAMLGGGAYYGLVLYPQGQIEQAMRKAQDLRMTKQHEAAIQTLEAAFARYPQAMELKSTRDAVEAEWLEARVKQQMDAAQAASGEGKFEAAVRAYEEALGIEAKGKNLPTFTAHAQLPVLKKKAEDLSDFTKFMDAGTQAEKDLRYADAIAAYNEAAKLEAKPGREAATGATRAAFNGLVADSTKYEKEMNYPAALEAANKAADLKFEDVSKLQERLKRNIQHDKLVAEAEADEKGGNLRPAAAKFEQAAGFAASDSAGDALRTRARDLNVKADYNDAMAKGQAALKAGDWNGADAAFKNALVASSKDEGAMTGLRHSEAGKANAQGEAAAKELNWKAAYDAYAKAAQLNPDQPEYANRSLSAAEQVKTIADLMASAREQEKSHAWEKAAQSYAELAKLDGPQALVHEQRAKNALFEKEMEKVQGFYNEGNYEMALKTAKSAMPLDPAGGQKAQAQIELIQTKLNLRNAAEQREQTVGGATKLVQEGKLTTAIAMLADALRGAPNDQQLLTLKASLEDVSAIEKSYARLEEIRLDAIAAIDMGLTCDKGDKKMNAWKASVEEWKDRLAEGRANARSAWMERKFDNIKPAYDGMRSKAQELAQLYVSLSGNFAGKSASAAKPKANIGGIVGGYGGHSFGGLGASGDVGDNQKHAGIYKTSSESLGRAAEETRRFSVSE